MNQLEDRIATVLHGRAAGDVDVTGLLDTARTRGRAYRRRRRALRVGGGCAVAAVAVLGAAVVVPRIGGHRPARPPLVGAPPVTASPSAFPSPRPSAVLSWEPRVTSGTPASVDPSVVGADPALLHVDLPTAAMPVPVTRAQWASIDGLERIIVDAVQVQVSGDRTALDPLDGATHPVTIGAKAGSMSGSQVRWEPVPGVWAQLTAPGSETDVLRLAGALRFDRVLRCAVPFRLTGLPSGTALEACGMDFTATGVTGHATVHSGQWSVTVDVEPGGKVPAPTTTIGGRPASVREYPGDGGATIMQVDIDYGDHVVDLLAEGRYDRSTVLAIAAGYRDLTGTAPEQWPSPLG